VPTSNHLYKQFFLESQSTTYSLFIWLVADGWCWFVLREKYYWLVAGGWFVLREKYCWLVADKPSEQAGRPSQHARTLTPMNTRTQTLPL
jgi:hypothetical protein